MKCCTTSTTKWKTRGSIIVIVSTAGMTRIAAYCVVTDEAGRVLLCRLSPSELDVGKWTLPGGGLEFGEDPAVAAVRELEEETGLVGRVTELLGVDGHLYPPRPGRDLPLHAVRVVYRAEPIIAELRHELSGSTDRAEWFTRAQLPSIPTVDLVEWAIGPWGQGVLRRHRTAITPAEVITHILGHWELSSDPPPRALRAPAGGREAVRVGVFPAGSV